MSFFDRLRGDGKLHREGEFTLDVEQAGSKLSRFQFRDDRDFLFHLVGGLFRLGAEGVEVEWKANRLSVRMLDLVLAPEFLTDLPSALLEENSPQRRLAAAAQALLVHKLVRFDWIGSGKGQVYDYLSGQGQNWQQVALREIQLEGLPSGLVDRALAELNKRAIYCRKSLRVAGRALAIAGTSTELGGMAAARCRPGQPSQLELVVDEMVCPPKPVSAPFPWHGVCYGDFRLDVSLSNVVEDEVYGRAWEAIEGSFPRCLEAVTDREVLGKLLTGPVYEWLAPILPRLRGYPLFTDQRGRKWSLAELVPPVYYSNQKAPVDLPETILVESSAVMKACLQTHLGEDCRHAGEVILRQLRRQLNQHEWSKRPQTDLNLPDRNWLVHKTYEQSSGRWLLGIQDDWASPGGSVTLLHQGRPLCTRRLGHPEIAFACICEVSEVQINGLWDDLTESAWKELEPRWLHCVEELVRELAEGGPPQGSLRSYLVEHLSRCQRPQDSYFSKTLLFQDWHGKLYSLDQLLELQALICLVEENQPPLKDFVPDAVFLRGATWETRLFQKVPRLKLLEFRYLLADLQAGNGEFRERSELLPGFGQGLIHFCVRGVRLESHRVDSVLAFQSWVRADELSFHVRLENQELGTARFRLNVNPQARRLLDKLVEEARQLPVPLPLDEKWREWAREATLRQMASPDLACWPTLRHGPVSLKQLRQADRVSWTSGPGSAQFGSERLLIQLSPARQSFLQSQCQNQWICQDAWFAEQERMRVFLEGPTWSPAFQSVARQPGIWLLGDASPGKLIYLLRGRWLREQDGVLPSGLRATIDCEGFDDQPNLDEKLQQVRDFLKQWLSQARSREHMKQWREWEHWDPELGPLLRRQPWFLTSQKPLSWEELLARPEFFRVVALHPGLTRERLYVAESGVPIGLLDSLQAHHRKGHSVAQTDKLLQEEKRLAAQRRLMEEQRKRLQGVRFKRTLEWGEVGLSGKPIKDFWLLLSDRAVLIHNVPAGLVGAMKSEGQHRLRRVAGQEHAELGQALRRQFYEALLPLILERVQAGRLKAAELDMVCEYLMLTGAEKMAAARWIGCADGSLTSLAQLKIDSQEREELGYWPKTYALSPGGARIIPILSTPLLLEVVGRYCGMRPVQLPKPLLHQDVKMPSFGNVGQVLRALGSAADRLREGIVTLETRRASLFETLFPRPTPPPEAASPVEGEGKLLLTALRRQAAQLTQGAARRELLRVLEKATMGKCRGLWDFTPELVLSSAELRAYSGDQEPPVEVVLSLLLSLVSAINARSEPFTDEMEQKFLGSLTTELVGSWATSGNAGSGEIKRS
ncbi:hypothetical protein ABS71_20095 [bacterium SCN 62-11]|nr:MAG: hypothetical protein ABS71_20095 [bacterium SCN 62-11]